MSWQQFKNDYLTFTRKDRIGILCFVLFILIIYLLPLFFAAPPKPAPLAADSTLLQAIDTLDRRQAAPYRDYQSRGNKSYDNGQKKTTPAGGFMAGALFTFDPNTLPEAGWRRLGLNEKTSRTIIRYREKGGRFYQPADIRKIWGMPDGFYERVKDYISIPPPERNNAYAAPFPKKEKDKQAFASLDINAADTAALIALPGIGSKLAARIVHFREKLGGFYSVDQMGETYGLPDTTFQQLKPFLKATPGNVKRININTAGKEELKAHPYIKWQLANSLVEYRTQHGRFGSVEDLKKIMIVDDALFQKLSPYVSVE